MRTRYRRKAGPPVVAIQLALDMQPLRYRKWDHEQTAQPGDWLLDNAGDVYTVSAASFAATYREVSRGLYVKVARVWAERASEAGSVATQEGRTGYQAGDWLVSNREDGGDAYAIAAGTFEDLYEADEDPPQAA